jgi:hypothetical protein
MDQLRQQADATTVKIMKTLLLATVAAVVATQCYAADLKLNTSVKNMANGKSQLHVSVSGQIKSGDDLKLASMTKGYSESEVLISFDSPGGDLGTGLKIGQFIRRNRFETFVRAEATCASACALAWLAGTPRTMSSSAHIGFHSAYRKENGRPSVSGPGNALVGTYLRDLGLSYSAVKYITQAAPTSMEWLTFEEARQHDIKIELFKTAEAKPSERSRNEAIQKDEYARVVASETNQSIGYFSSVNPDCTSRGDVKVRVTKQPEHGMIETTAATYRDRRCRS